LRGLVLFVERSSPAEMKAQNWQLLTGAIILSLAVIVQCQGRSTVCIYFICMDYFNPVINKSNDKCLGLNLAAMCVHEHEFEGM
jgi:hypothetical protein